MSIATELTKLSNTKLDIKHAIQDKGVIVHDEDTFNTYADKIESIAGYGENIDISKTDYSIGNGGYPTVIEEGRLFHPIYYAGTNVVIRPMDNSGNWLDVNWTKDFEIFVTFQVTNLSSQLSLFTNGILNTSYEYSPTIFLSNNTLRVLLCSSGSSWNLIYDTNFTPIIDTWYALSMKYTSSTNEITVDISTDFENWTNLMNQVLTFTIQHDTASLIFGGRGYEPQNWNPGNLIIDTFNTYIKDDTGDIVWGAFAGRFDNSKYTVISKDYDLVEYIESDGTQVIDLGVNLNANDVVECIYVPLSGMTNWNWLWIAEDINTSKFSGVVFMSSSQMADYDYSVESNRRSWTANQISESSLTASAAINANVKFSDGAIVKLYSLSINNNYFLPCKRKSDGVFGLFDVANQAFLTDSAGGNPLTGGPTICVFDEASTDIATGFNLNLTNIVNGTSTAGLNRTDTITEKGTYVVIMDHAIYSGITNTVTYNGDYNILQSYRGDSDQVHIDIIEVIDSTTITMYSTQSDWVSYAIIKIDNISSIGNILFEQYYPQSNNIVTVNTSSFIQPSTDYILVAIYGASSLDSSSYYAIKMNNTGSPPSGVSSGTIHPMVYNPIFTHINELNYNFGGVFLIHKNDLASISVKSNNKSMSCVFAVELS